MEYNISFKHASRLAKIHHKCQAVEDSVLVCSEPTLQAHQHTPPPHDKSFSERSCQHCAIPRSQEA